MMVLEVIDSFHPSISIFVENREALGMHETAGLNTRATFNAPYIYFLKSFYYVDRQTVVYPPRG